ncbi:MMPL family transporter [Actinopolymorpha sp. B11F2]|uniref:MMPL family transporter n=1 Tax=Actinopolymorpha sp. B11F2 TaxID=3160862 RepID=UPI0032E37C6C
MLAQWASFVARRRWWVLAVAAVLAILAGTASTTLTDRMDQGGYDVPGSESERAATAAGRALDNQADALAVYTVPAGRSVQDPTVQNAVRQAVGRLPDAQVAGATGWWQQPALVSADNRTGAVAIQLRAEGQNGQLAAWPDVEDALLGTGDTVGGRTTYGVDGLTLRFSGWTPMGDAVNAQTEEDLARAELISFPVLLIVLVLVFGGLIAAGLPLVVGAVGITGALGVLWVLTTLTDVSVFAMNVVTLLGLGLAVDYGLFVVSRFREELRAGDAGDGTTGTRADAAMVQRAVTVALSTAGRTVLVSGLTVAAALSGLLVFPQGMLRSIGFGGIAAVVVAALSALTVLPALLSVLGHRIDRLRVPIGRGRRPGVTAADPELNDPSGHRRGHDRRGWARVGRVVMRRPALVTVVVVAGLLVVGSPFLRAEFSEVDASVLPKDNAVRMATEHVRATLPGASTEAAQVVLVGSDGRAPEQRAVQAYAEQASRIDGITGVAPAGSSGDTVVLTAQVHDDPQSQAAQDAVTHLRDIAAPAGTREVLVGGPTAALIDSLDAIGDRMPWMLAVLAGAVLLLLTVAFGSLVVPVKAVVLSALSLTASFGAIVWVFQDGYLVGLLGTEAGPLEASIPVLMLAVLFGLSTDYELFLLSRIAEAYRSGRTPRDAVVDGLARTGGLITAAALLLGIVVGAFALSGLKFMKLLGVGMLIAIAVDATIVRGLLVPAVLALLGTVAWWAPRPLRRLAGVMRLEPTERELDAGVPLAAAAPTAVSRSDDREIGT